MVITRNWFQELAEEYDIELGDFEIDVAHSTSIWAEELPNNGGDVVCWTLGGFCDAPDASLVITELTDIMSGTEKEVVFRKNVSGIITGAVRFGFAEKRVYKAVISADGGTLASCTL